MVFTSVPLYLDPPNWNNNNQQQQQVQVQQQQQLSSHGGGHLFPSAVGGGGGGGGFEAHHHHHQHQPQQQQQQQMSALMAPPRPPDGSSMGLGSGAVAGGGASGGGGAGTAAVKAGSMTDRARMAKLPAPEARLKCPRCESSNTKFCYFNNYSLSQPRYFCKACRRYWTQGGTLRNVPVGGGCRRNKRTKSSKSSSSSSASAAAAAGGTGNNTASSSATTSSATTGGIMPPGAALGQMPFFAASLVSGGGEHYGGGGLSGASRGLGFPGMMSSQLDPAVDHYHHQLAAGGGGMVGMDQQWRLPPQMQQFPFFGGRATADAISGMQAQLQQQMPAGINNYPFEPDAGEGFAAGQMMGGGGGKQVPGSAGLITQLASVKMEDNPPAMAREFLGLPAAGSLQFWAGGNGGGNNGGSGVGSGGAGAQGGGGGWVDNLSGFNSSSSGNIL